MLFYINAAFNNAKSLIIIIINHIFLITEGTKAISSLTVYCISGKQIAYGWQPHSQLIWNQSGDFGGLKQNTKKYDLKYLLW